MSIYTFVKKKMKSFCLLSSKAPAHPTPSICPWVPNLMCNCWAEKREELSLKSEVMWEDILHSSDFTTINTPLSYLYLIAFNTPQ